MFCLIFSLSNWTCNEAPPRRKGKHSRASKRSLGVDWPGNRGVRTKEDGCASGACSASRCHARPPIALPFLHDHHELVLRLCSKWRTIGDLVLLPTAKPRQCYGCSATLGLHSTSTNLNRSSWSPDAECARWAMLGEER